MKRLHTIIPRRVGLARALSKLGYCSRSQGFELIRAGRVKLNDRTRRDPECPVNLEKDRIEVDHQRVSIKARIYLMLNKPRGVVTTASDEKGRKTVYSCLVQNLDPIIRRPELQYVARNCVGQGQEPAHPAFARAVWNRSVAARASGHRTPHIG